MAKKEGDREQERKRIIALIDLWRDTQDMGTSVSAGELIDVINGRNEEYRKWLVRRGKK